MIRKKNYPNLQKKLCGGELCSPSHFAGGPVAPLSKLSANALNNSRRRIKVKDKGGLPSALSFSDLSGTYTKDKVRPRNGLVQEGILAAMPPLTWHAAGKVEMAYIRGSCKSNFDSLKLLSGDVVGSKWQKTPLCRV